MKMRMGVVDDPGTSEKTFGVDPPADCGGIHSQSQPLGGGGSGSGV